MSNIVWNINLILQVFNKNGLKIKKNSPLWRWGLHKFTQKV